MEKIILMKSTKMQTLGANTICVCDWTATGARGYIHTLVTDTTVLKQASGT